MNQSFIATDPGRFQAALRRFDEENSQDPNRESQDGQSIPRELLYAQWLTDWVLRLKPDASEALRLAARGAHLRRWDIARASYPATRAGYLRWRSNLKLYHAQRVTTILREVGYPEETIAHVQDLVSKSSFPQDPDSRILEDALCLVFLEHQFEGLTKKNTADKVVNAVRKSWQKMTPAARERALTLPYTPQEKLLLQRALGSTGECEADPKK